MDYWIILLAVVIFLVAAFLDLKSKGLAYKLMPKPLKELVDRSFNRK